MKKITLLLILGVFLLQGDLFAQRNCYSHEYLLQEIQHDPQRLIRLQQIEEQTKRIISSGQLNGRSVVTIPTVVHIVYYRRDETQNISEDQIQSQMDVLNADFRRMNTDADDTWPQAADAEIEFCLVGVTRTSSRKRSHGTTNSVKFSNQGGQDAWPAEQYLNIWVCDIGGGILGYAQFPGGNPSTDGIVVDYRVFGTIGTATAPFDLGRTATHEVGHYLGLRHIWGDGGCGVDDGIEDTPIAGAPNDTGLPCNEEPDTCPDEPGSDMFQNYMDYSDDGCMNLFTTNQSEVMQAILAGTRASLIANSGICVENPPTPEICDNGIDDDGDGDIDCADSDCTSNPDCQVAGPCDPADVLNATTATSDNGKGKKVDVFLSWSGGTSTGDYTVQIRESGSTAWSNYSSSGTSGTIKLDRGVSYDWQVITNCSGNETAISAMNTFVAGQDGSSRLTNRLEEIQVYPNPARNVVNIDLSGFSVGRDQKLQMTDIMGRTVRERLLDQGTGSIQISTGNLPAGLYLIRFHDRDGKTQATAKLLIQH